MKSFSSHLRRAALLIGALALGGVFAAVYATEKTDAPALAIKLDATSVPRGQYDPASYSDVVSRVSPSVVKITVETKAKHVPMNENAFPGMSDPFFRQFFGNQVPEVREPPSSGLGSGVIISPDGYIVTNNHVVDGADSVHVTLPDGTEYKARVVGRDPKTDIAVVKVDASNLPAATFADSAKIRAGDRVLAIGNPLGIGETVTSGIVSGTGRNVGLLQDVHGYEDFIQTDAAINPGNSGGALVDIDGRLIGINTAILTNSGRFEGVGLAVPSDMVRAVAESLVKNGKVVRGYLGINIQNITPELQDSFSLGSRKGALVAEVVPGSPASRAGLKDGDVITSLDGRPISDSTDLQLAVSDDAPATHINLGVVRDGKAMDVVATTGELPGSQGSESNAYADNNDQGVLNGVGVDDLNSNTRQQFNIPEDLQGAIITSVDPNSAAAAAGISAGDVILSINRHRVASAQDAVDLSAKATNRKTLVRLWSHGSTLYVVVDESGTGNSPS